MTFNPLRAIVGATLLCALPAAPAFAQGCATATETAQAPKPKKKGFGLGGLLKAAKNAGVGDMLGGGGMLGNGKLGQVAGAVAGTAMNATGGGAVGLPSALIGFGGANPVAQLAGAATGTVAELARMAPRKSDLTAPAAGSACAADVGAIVNLYK
jgi:hypothetical protein